MPYECEGTVSIFWLIIWGLLGGVVVYALGYGAAEALWGLL